MLLHIPSRFHLTLEEEYADELEGMSIAITTGKHGLQQYKTLRLRKPMPSRNAIQSYDLLYLEHTSQDPCGNYSSKKRPQPSESRESEVILDETSRARDPLEKRRRCRKNRVSPATPESLEGF
jgi:hypothetical protein